MSLFTLFGRDTAIRAVLGFTFSHWRRQRLRAAAILAAIGASTLAEVMTPLYSGRLVDAIANGAPGEAVAWDAAWAAFVALVLLGLVALTGRYLTFTTIVAFTLQNMRTVVADAFHRVQRFSTDWHANSFAGSTVRKVSRGMWALDLLNDTLLIALFPAAAMLIGTTVLLGWHWPVMGLVTGLGSLAYLVLTAVLSLGYVAPAATLSNAWDTRLGGALADAISCNSVVKAFGAEAREDARLAWVTDKWASRTRRTWMRGTLNGTAQGAALLGLRAAVIGLALVLWARGRADAGDLAFVLTAFFVLQGYLREVGQHIRNLQRSVNDMEELVALYHHPLGVADRPHAALLAAPRGEIVFDRVTFHYGQHLTPLYRDFSLTIAAGERVGLVGHSGSGKTTFVKLVQRLYDVTGGRILIDGQDISDVEQSSLRSRIAIVQQEPILFHRSLAENIAYGRPGATMDEIAEAARLASAHDFITRLPKGYGTLVGERGVKLSGGERQRVALARAFLADAPILILDEATSSLDSESEMLIQRAMERLMVGRTTIVIAHRLSTVRALDRLLVFDRGRVVEEGDHESLTRRPEGIYRRLFERQAIELVRGLAVEVMPDAASA
ncbi:ABC transporter ATP-binding protein [Consotaella aegiceratis]|uniref:ABC transporter ATP-binding protein n=1 Tax=Consotaella aegiceratis TaxID=3097961 RepID=UPI002F40B559